MLHILFEEENARVNEEGQTYCKAMLMVHVCLCFINHACHMTNSMSARDMEHCWTLEALRLAAVIDHPPTCTCVCLSIEFSTAGLSTCVKRYMHADWPWVDEKAMWDRCTATEAAVKTDHAAAIVLIKAASQQPTEVPMVDVSADDDTQPPIATTSAEPLEAPAGSHLFKQNVFLAVLQHARYSHSEQVWVKQSAHAAAFQHHNWRNHTACMSGL